MNTRKTLYSLALLSILLLTRPESASCQNTALEGLTQEEKTAILALEMSEEQLYQLYSQTFNLWASKKRECELLQKQLDAKTENETLLTENLRIETGRLHELQEKCGKLDKEVERLNRRVKVGKVVSKIGHGLAFALGVYVGFRLF